MAKTKTPTPDTNRAAYQEGPAEICFAGKRWQRGVAQPVTAEAWAAMQKRADFKQYQFTEEK